MVVCPACAAENPKGVRFCGSCGGPLVVVCASCGSDNPPGFRFCGNCAASLVPEEEPAPAPAAGERRRVTVLFADLVGFSTLAEHLDPEELRTLMTETFAELTEEVERRGGWVEKFIGDAVVAVFGAPVTHEDDPVRAVEAALAMHDVLQRRSDGAPAPLQLRAGVNTGVVVAGPVGDGTQTGVMGDAVNVAARLQQAADPGAVVVAAATWRRVRGRFEGEPIGALDVRGRAQAVEAWRIVGHRSEEVRRRVQFVGRRDELALLELLWSSARKGNTHVVSVVGEPGVGKSRLLTEFRPAGAALDLRIACGGSRAFGPFLDALEQLLGGVPRQAEELVAKAAALGVAEEDAQLLAPFLGLGSAPPGIHVVEEQRQRQVFAGFWQFLLAVSAGRPAFVALDDVHWADESSRKLLDFLLERLSGMPLMFVLCYRPGFDQIDRAEFRASHTGIRLEPLSAEESVALAREFLGASRLPTDLEQLVAGRAEGNPFFIEELLQALMELGQLEVVDGRTVLAKVDVEVPDTVQGTILARVDLLEARERLIMQHAAVLGRSFSGELLEAVVGEGDLSDSLAELLRAQLLVEPHPGEWTFKHALIQEVTYETLLLRHRQELHRKTAEALEPRAADDPSALEALAEHYARGDAPEPARRYALAAGDLARERMRFVEAQRRYETAARLWGSGEEPGRLELLEKLGRTAMVAGDQSAARTALVEAEEGWRRVGDLQRAGATLAVLGRAYWITGESDRAADALERAIALLAERVPSPELVQAYTWASTLHMLQGKSDKSIRLAELGLALADELGLEVQRAHLLTTLGSARVMAGDLEGAAQLQEALDVARGAGDVEALARAYTNLTDLLWLLGELHEAVEIGREALDAMRAAGAPAYQGFIATYLAISLADLGLLDEAEGIVDHVLQELRGVFGGPGTVRAGTLKATILCRRGSYDEARKLLDEVVPLARGIGGPEFLGIPLTQEADLEHARGNRGSARQAALAALGVVSAEPGAFYQVEVLPVLARVLGAEVAPLLEQVRDLSLSPLQKAHVAEADALLARDPARSREAAELYAGIPMPYHEARCRIDAGDVERARELVERLGVPAGPLGQRLQEPRPIHSSPSS
jgi:adenylate cyclase